jgi:transcriptional regulator with XRE-family HTH domain
MKNPAILFGKKVREIRLKRGMSQGDLAKILGVHRAYVSGIERGVRNPSLVTIEKFAKAFGIKSSELLKY